MTLRETDRVAHDCARCFLNRKMKGISDAGLFPFFDDAKQLGSKSIAHQLLRRERRWFSGQPIFGERYRAAVLDLGETLDREEAFASSTFTRRVRVRFFSRTASRNGMSNSSEAPNKKIRRQAWYSVVPRSSERLQRHRARPTILRRTEKRSRRQRMSRDSAEPGSSEAPPGARRSPSTQVGVPGQRLRAPEILMRGVPLASRRWPFFWKITVTIKRQQRQPHREQRTHRAKVKDQVMRRVRGGAPGPSRGIRDIDDRD